MKKISLFIVIFTLISCSNIDRKSLHVDDLVGGWYRSEILENEVFHEEVEYLPNGRKCTYSQTLYSSGAQEYSYYISMWQLKEGGIQARVINSSSKYVPVGLEFFDRIELLSEFTLENQMLLPFYGDSIEKYYRTPYNRIGGVCKWVEKYFNI